MKRAVLFGLAGALALSTAASAQMMGNGQYWYSGDGSIPNFSEAIDGDISNIKAHGYNLEWKPSDITRWGDTYGYSRDSDLESRRIRIYAIDVDNNLYLADGEDPAENGTDADLICDYYFAWDEDNFYAASDNTDNHYDIIPAPDMGDDAFWQRDTFWISFDLSDGQGPNNGNNIVEWRVSPLNTGEAGHSMHIAHYQDGTGNQVIYGADPSYFMGAEVRGGPTAKGYYFEANVPWDLIFLFAPELRGNVGAGYAFRMRYIIPDPDGDDSYGQTYFGGDQGNLGENDRWPRFTLSAANTSNQTAVEATTWGSVKSRYR
jgi:hypothetical protein